MTNITHRTALHPLADDALISREEFAVRLGISLSTLHRWVSNGMIPPPARLGRRHSVWHSDVVRLTLRRLTRSEEAEKAQLPRRIVRID